MLDYLEITKYMTGKIKRVLSIVLTYLFIVSTATFACFILEESGQVFIWSTWPAKDVGRWDLVKNGLEGMKKSRQTLNLINYSLGWLNPLAFLSYRAFANSVNSYEDALMANILAKFPAAYLEKEIEFEFTATQMMKDKNGIRLLGGGIVVWVNQEVRPGKFQVKAKVELRNNVPSIVASKINRR